MEANFALHMNITVGIMECMLIPVLMTSGQASNLWVEYSLDRYNKELVINLFFMSPHFLVGAEAGRLK